MRRCLITVLALAMIAVVMESPAWARRTVTRKVVRHGRPDVVLTVRRGPQPAPAKVYILRPVKPKPAVVVPKPSVKVEVDVKTTPAN